MGKINPQIGTCPCPMRDCKEVMAVKRFTARTDNAIRQRRAGLLYADCPVHGRVGGDGSKAMQDYLLDKGDLWNDEELAAHRKALEADELARKRAQIQRPSLAPATKAPAPPSSGTSPAPGSSTKKSNSLW